MSQTQPPNAAKPSKADAPKAREMGTSELSSYLRKMGVKLVDESATCGGMVIVGVQMPMSEPATPPDKSPDESPQE